MRRRPLANVSTDGHDGQPLSGPALKYDLSQAKFPACAVRQYLQYRSPASRSQIFRDAISGGAGLQARALELNLVMIFDHPRRALVLDKRPGNRATILRSEIYRHGSHGCSDRRCSVRAFDDSGEAVGGRHLARTPPRRVTRWLATSTITPQAPALSSAGDEPRPHHVILDCKIAARLFRRCPRSVKSRITPANSRMPRQSSSPR